MLIYINIQAQTKIGWNQTHINGTTEYKVEYCDEISCYAEFGFKSPFFKNVEQFYFFKKDSQDNAKLFFISKEIEYVETFTNWNIYYLHGMSINEITQQPKEKEFTLMLQNATFEQWRSDTIPTLIQLYPIDSTNNYPIYTFEPPQIVIDSFTSYTATNQRAIDLNNNIELDKKKFRQLDSLEQFNLTFYSDFVEFDMHGQQEVWLKEQKDKFYRNGSWHYQLHSAANDSLILEFKMQKDFNWKNAQCGKLNSLQMWSNDAPHIVSEIIFDIQ